MTFTRKVKVPDPLIISKQSGKLYTTASVSMQEAVESLIAVHQGAGNSFKFIQLTTNKKGRLVPASEEVGANLWRPKTGEFNVVYSRGRWLI